MKSLSAQLFFAGIVIMMLPGSCKKPVTVADNCAAIQKIKITGAKATYYTGDSINLSTNMLAPIALYSWNHGDNSNPLSEDAGLFIYSCTKNDEGWYYLAISYPDCAAHFDSVYISVINRPATAPCDPANNTVSFSALPDITIPSTTWGYDASWNCKNLSGDYAIGYPDFNIYFNYFWNTIEPEDGAYNISNTITFDDNDAYSVFIASTYSSTYFEANSSGKVYVSHVNGKLQVSFCDITLTGSLGGPSYTTTATGKLTAP